MLQCRFCGAKSQPQYLFLLCKHLSCISCAFLRAEFASQTIQCCGKTTTINENSLEKIIANKRHIKNGSKCNQFQSQKSDKQKNHTTIFKQFNTKIDHRYKQEPQQIQISSPQSFIKQLKQSEIKQNINKIIHNQDYVTELQNILIKQIEKIRKQFQLQRQILKQKQDNCIKDLLLLYEEEMKNIERPINKIKLDKFNSVLSKSRLTQPLSQRQKNQRNQNESLATNSQKSKESYDHILKRLEVNQQRMKQKIQKHLETTN